MGQFSWMYADTNNKEALLEGGEAFLVLPNGEYLHETDYDDYGNFDGQDVYELVAEWNRAYLAEHPEYEIPEHGGIPMPDGTFKKFPDVRVDKYGWYKAYADLTKTKEEVELETDMPFRNIGIDIACYDDQNAKLPYPIKVCKYVPHRPEELPASEGDPNQGWGEPDEEEDEEGEEYEPSRSEYTVALNYGYQRSHDTYETYHAFELTDHVDGPGDDVMAAHLAEQLDTTPDDEDFDWNMMDVALPKATVARIQRDYACTLERGTGLFTTYFDDGSVVVTPCKIDLDTAKITDIESAPVSPCANVEKETVTISGIEYGTEQNEDGDYIAKGFPPEENVK